MRDHHALPGDAHRAGASHGSPRRSRHALFLALVALGLFSAGLAARSALGDRDGTSNPSLRRLADAVGSFRAIAPRLTGGFRHVPCPTDREPDNKLVSGLVCRAAPGGAARDQLVRFAARFRAGAGRSEDTTSQSRHTAGVFALLWPELEGSVERAVGGLRRVVGDEPQNARVLNDLAAALLVHAEVTANPADLVEAVIVLDEALRRDSTVAEAWFNRALALELLFLESEAAIAWETYLRTDPGSAWAQEARTRLTRLSRSPFRGTWPEQRVLLDRAAHSGDTVALEAIVRTWPQEVREYVLEELLPAWAETGRDSLLATARTIGKSILAVTRDALAADGAASIDEATGERDLTRLAAIREGLRALGQGDRLYDRLEHSLATEHLASAERLLAAGRTPLREWAAYSLVRTLYLGAAHDAALRHAAAIRRRTTPERYPLVWGLAAHMEGLIREIRGLHARAYRERLVALNVLRTTGDAGVIARQLMALAQLSGKLYGEQESWRFLYQALKLKPSIANRIQRFAVLEQVPLYFSRPAPGLAILYQHEALALADSLGDPLRSLYGFRRRAELWARVDDLDRAAQDLRAAERYLEGLPDERTRETWRSDLLLTAGEIQSRTDPAAALRVLNGALPVFRSVAYRDQLPRVYLALARTHLAQEALQPARAAFDSAIAEVERQRRWVDDPVQRARFLDRARPVFDEIVAVEADHGLPESAFDYFEQTRARTLVEQVGVEGRVGSTTLAAREIRRRLSPGVVLATYAVLENQLLIWVVTRDRLRLARVNVTSDQLMSLVDRLRVAILDPEGAAGLAVAAGKLHEVLVAPLEPDLSSGARLVVVLDKWLHFLPLAVLQDGRTGRFLIEEHPLAVAPSASLYVQAASGRRRPAIDGRARALVIGNPAFDRSVLTLGDLPHAELEARRVGASYRDARLLLGADATKRAFLAQAPQYDVIHFAGHAVVRPEAPRLSHLVLAADSSDQDPGTLYAEDLYRLRLRRTDLVILSGCRTAGGRLSPTEGASSLARAFLAAGVPAVVASLWEVEDESTAEFFAVYHRLVSELGDPVAALQSAQREFMESKRSDPRAARTWAAFQIFGGA